MTVRCLYLIFLWGMVACLQAQVPAMWHLTEEQGLPSRTVYQIVQDQQGFMWLGTQKGLYRYDGRVFKKYPLADFLDQEIVILQIDSWNRVWFNNLSGQIGWVEEEQIQMLSVEGISDDLLPKRMCWLEKNLWVSYPKAGNFGIAQLHFDASKKPPSVQLLKGNIDRITSKVIPWKNNYLISDWQIEANRLKYHVIENDSIRLQEETLDLTKIKDQSSTLNIVLSPAKEQLLLKTFKGIYQYRFDSLETIIAIPNSPINTVVYLNDQFFILTNGGGVKVLDYYSLQMVDSFLQGVNVNVGYQDVEQNIWLGTTGQGIFIIPNSRFRQYDNSNNGLPRNDVNSLFTSPLSNTLYVGLSDGKMVAFAPEQKQGKNIELPPLGRITTMIEDSWGLLWMGCDVGICRYDALTQKAEHLPRSSTAKALAFANDQSLWIGESSRTRRKKNGELNNGEDYELDPNEVIVNKRTYALLEDSQNKMWIGTTEGIYYYQKDSLHPFLEQGLQKQYRISAIVPTADSSLWVGTSGDGLLCIQNDSVIKRFDISNGLVSNNITGLSVEKEFFFIGTDNGLNILNLSSQQIDLIDNRDGLPSNEINALSLRGSEVWVGTPKGLITFSLEDIRRNERPPPIYFSELSINGQDTTLHKNYHLSYRQNALTFNFVSPCFRARGKENYKYQLKGLKEQWTVSDNRFARFHALPPGDYQFEVYAINEDGVESASPAVLNFYIATPWWKSWWFYTLLVIALIALSSILVYWRQRDLLQRERTERDLQEKIQQLKLDALKTQMNPHFIYNSLNAIQDFLVTNDSTQALFYLSRFARLIRTIFDLSNREVVSLEEELEFLNLYLDLEKLRFSDRVTIEMTVDDVLQANADNYYLPPLLLQPLIENAFKHGLMHKISAGNLSIHFSALSGHHLQCTITDNGIGRTKAIELDQWRADPKHHGSLQSIEERLRLFHTERNTSSNKQYLKIIDLVDDQGLAAGTQIAVIV